jgi:uncharacterized protein YbjT (DUF2867 family)
MITVMGATGHTGQYLVEQLLRSGEQVRALGRSASRLEPLARLGASVLVGEPTNAAFLSRAFRNASAVYTLLPYDMQVPDYYAMQQAQGEAIVQALRENGTGHVVFHSSLGAELPSGTGPIASMHAQEMRLRGLNGCNVLMLRTGALFENFYGALGVIKQAGLNGDTVAPDLPIPMIATRDLADVAAKALIARDWHGIVVRELLGPCDLSYAQATRILGEHIGQPALNYVQLTPADMTGALLGAGFSPNLAGLYVELAQAINQGRIKSLEGRHPGNTTPTRFEDFAPELAAAYQAM